MAIFDLPEKDVLRFSFLAVVIIESLIEIYLSVREIIVCKTALTVPKELTAVMSQDIFDKARLYRLDSERFRVFKILIMDVLLVAPKLYYGVIGQAWQTAVSVSNFCGLDSENEIVVTCTLILISAVCDSLKALPFKIYKIFVLEERHGFNKQTLKSFAWDYLKSFCISTIISVPMTGLTVAIVLRGGDYFFLWLWGFTNIFVLMLMTVYPIFIAPLFDTYRPLEQGSLRKAIEELASSLKFPLTQLYVIEGSKRSSHSNAYLYGMWNSKRIVLFDTLLLNRGKADTKGLSEEDKAKGCTNEEVLAVVGHELGHWKRNHLPKGIAIMQFHLLTSFAVFAYCFRHASLYEAVGLPIGTRPVIIGMMIVFSFILAPLNMVVGFATTLLSRRFEYEADEFAHQLGFSKALALALIKVHSDNLSFPVHDWLYSTWKHSHPTLLQRLDRLKQLDQAKVQAAAVARKND